MFYSNRLKLISDENIPTKLTELLVEKGFDVKRAPLSSTDKQLAKIAKSESRIILTFDKHFVNKRLFPPENFGGIIFLQIHPPIIEAVLSALLNLFEKIKQLEFKGKLFILSRFGFKVRQ